MTKNIEESIELAIRHQSKLDAEVIKIEGLTCLEIRHLLNNLAYNRHYLEIGLYKGATFIAANYNGNSLSSIGVDNWCKFNENGQTKRQFIKNCDKYLKKYQFLEQDCFTIEKLNSRINLFYYDGDHSETASFNALKHFTPMCCTRFIYLVDDWNYETVRAGTQRAIQNLSLEVLSERTMKWWNGFYIAELKKSFKELL